MDLRGGGGERGGKARLVAHPNLMHAFQPCWPLVRTIMCTVPAPLCTALYRSVPLQESVKDIDLHAAAAAAAAAGDAALGGGGASAAAAAAAAPGAPAAAAQPTGAAAAKQREGAAAVPAAAEVAWKLDILRR